MNKFIVYSGNNPDVIRDALLKRGNWEQVPIEYDQILYNSQITLQIRFLKPPKTPFTMPTSYGDLATLDQL